MFVTGDSIVYSASDLAAAARCQYALLREFDAKLGRGPAVAVDDELMARAAVLGSAHEGRRLDQLRHEFGDAVAIIGRPAYTPAGLAAAADATRRAIANHAPVVYQAAMFDGRFVGFADFLIRDGHRYRVADTKLARSPTVTALLQLAAYADALVHSGVPVAADAELELGDGTIVRYRVGELIPVYRSQRALLQRLLDGHYTAGTAVRWDDERVQACFRCPQCTERLRASDDLLLVGGMRVRQRDKLLEAGITTIAELADHTAPVPGLTTNALGKLTAQAKLQIRQRDTGAPQFEIVDPRPLTLLPEPNPGDLFFDFEGDPLWTADGKQWGLEYLFGVLEAGRAGVFRPLWAHDRTAERQALTDFLAIVARRRRRHPNMHIYHYAPYEKTALLRLVGRYGIGEDDVDDLLRNGVLVDLYPLVRKSIRVGTDSFSLKALEPLYLGTQPRSGDVTTAADSINSYARYCELRAAGRIDEAATVLKEIEGYNHYDCRSTRALRDWLLMRAWEAGVTPIGAQPVPDADPIDDGDSLASVLSKFTGDAAAGERTPEQTAVALLAAARGYHRREDKPFWWAHFDRLNYPVDEWSDSTDVFLASEASVTVDWHMPPRARKPQRRVRLTGELARGDLNGNVFALYEPPAPPGMTDNPDRRAAGPAAVVETDDPTVPTEVVIVERTRSDGNTFQQLPFALAPGPPVPTTALRESIESTAAAVASGSPQLPSTALMDVLLRRPPRTRSGAALPRSSDPVTDIAAAAGLGLVIPGGARPSGDRQDVHRGPGDRGVGHRACLAYWRCRPVARHGGEPVGRCDQRWPGPGAGRQKAARPHRWALAVDRREPVHRIHPRHRRMRDRRHGVGLRQRQSGAESQPGSAGDRRGWPVLPGQYHRRGARDTNLLLLGDPQQLPQVSQGTHPEPVDTSALSWLVDGQHTLPDERGYFLDRSYRMHPAVCAAVSALSYEGRLCSHTERTAVRRLDGYPRGAYAWRAPQGQFDRKPRRGRGDPRRAAAAARLAVDRRARHPATGRFRCACARAVQRPGGAGPSAVGVCRTWRG